MTTSPHASRFRTALALLVGLGLGALIIAAALIARGGDSGSSARWSSWAPQDGGTSGEREIAEHLAPTYRIDGTNQLAVVTVADLASGSATAVSTGSQSAGQLSSAGLKVAIRTFARPSSIGLLPGKTVAYNVCGLGSTDCSIGVGTPSSDRLLLLRREALELALYTFRYIGGTDNVVALLPPSHVQQSSTLSASPPNAGQTQAASTPVRLALLFLRDELGPFLSQPLDQTLQLPFPPTVGQVKLWKGTQEASLIEQVTGRLLFQQHLTQAQDGTNLIVLDQLPPQ